jgi:GH24 family phage-related lysozyme (muramidase)
MKIDLQNFFKYYDEKNPKHRAAVDQLEVDIDKKLLDDGANWVRIYRSKVEPPKSTILDVPYFPQTDNYTLPDTTCNSSSMAMCVEYLKPGTLTGEKGDDEYLRRVLKIGSSESHTVQTKVLESYGIYSVWRTDLTFKDLDDQLNKELPVPIGILHKGPLSAPYGGHIIVVIGKTSDGNYVVNDSYGNLLDGYTTNVYNGKRVVYPRSVLEKRWTVKNPNDGWGRVFITGRSEAASRVPEAALRIIKEYEGLSLTAYPDPLSGGKPITIGYGSTKRKDGSPFKMGDKITKEEAEELLIGSVEKNYLPSIEKIPYWSEMNINQRSALISFGYNLGANFYGSSGFNTISKCLKEKRWKDVPAAMMLYVNPGSSVEAGLRRRRAAEGSLWSK